MSESVIETWEPARHRRDISIIVSGPDAYVETDNQRAVAGRVTVWRICKIDVMWEWGDPNAEDAPGKPFVRLHTAHARTGAPTGGKLFLDQLSRVPDWVESIITRSMPRL